MKDCDFNVNLPLRDVVFNTLRDAILTGKLRPGQRLMENTLANKLGVSRTPVREALRMLQIENLVELVPKKGAQVLDMSKKDIINILQLREVLEVLGVRLACENMTEYDMNSLKIIHNDFEKALVGNDIEKMADIDELFHNTIFNSTDNDKLIQTITNLKIQLYRYRLANLKSVMDKTIIAKQHKSIINGILKRDFYESKKATLNHIKYHTECILKSLEK